MNTLKTLIALASVMVLTAGMVANASGDTQPKSQAKKCPAPKTVQKKPYQEMKCPCGGKCAMPAPKPRETEYQAIEGGKKVVKVIPHSGCHRKCTNHVCDVKKTCSHKRVNMFYGGNHARLDRQAVPSDPESGQVDTYAGNEHERKAIAK